MIASGLGICFSASALPSSAQETGQSGGLDEIVVTAQHREERLQDVPIAVSAVTASSLADTGVDASSDLPQIVPSVQFTRSGASGLFFVRGVGTTNAAVGEEGSNALYVDGVYMADLAQTVNNFNNIDRVEVLKGPQGTLFGRNATGGLIHVITREPGYDTVFQGQIGYGNYETVNARAYVATPVTDNLSVDLALTRTHQNEGWGRNTTLDRENKIQNFWGARSKAVFRPTDRLKFVLAGDYYENEDNLTLGYQIAPGTVNAGGATSPDGWWDTTLDNYPMTRQKIWGVSLTGEMDLDFATLTSISAYRKSRNHSDLDVDGGPAPLLNIGFVSGGKSIQQEVRLASSSVEPFSWQLGLFYLRSESDNDSFFSGAAFGGARGQHILADLKTNSYAAFGEATYTITPTTQLTAGIRYTADRRHFVGSQFTILANGDSIPGGTVTSPSGTPLPMPGIQDSRLKYNEITWRVALKQDITPDINVYASVNRGFKAGSYSLQSPLNDPYLPQFITAYEAGIKSELFDRRLRVNISGFHYDISDYQVRSAVVTNGVPGSSLVLNAATVKVDGVDLEFEAAPIEALRIFGGATWLNSRFDKFGGPGADIQAPITYPNANSSANPLEHTRCVATGSKEPGRIGTGPLTGGFTTCFGDASGNRTMNAPKFTASLGASYNIQVGETGSVRLSALYSYNSGFAFEPDNVQRQKEYDLINASVEYRPTENLGIELWGRNLGNTKYAVQKISTSGIAVTSAVGAPRTYGVNINMDF